MKKLISIILILLCLGSALFADTYRVLVTGKVYVMLSETEMLPLEEEDEVDDDDIIFVDEKSVITIFVNGNKLAIKKTGKFIVADKIKLLK